MRNLSSATVTSVENLFQKKTTVLPLKQLAIWLLVMKSMLRLNLIPHVMAFCVSLLQGTDQCSHTVL